MKRILASITLLGMLLSCSVAANAVEVEPFRASPTIASYNAWLFSGSGKGEITVSYEISASLWADSIGVERIQVRKEDGSLAVSILGSTHNGLVRNDFGIHDGDFDYTLSSGSGYYYAEVRVFAEYNGVYDSRTITTNTVWVR